MKKNLINKNNSKELLQENVNSTLKGQDIIKFIAKTLPHQPGVYQMEDNDGKILYIGKAKNLAKRVINYTSLNNLTRRLQRMVSLTRKMNFFVTNTEIEALLLECNLIKRHKPRFNIILRDDKSFPYILINKEFSYARLQKYRGRKKFKGDYFGPFVSPSVANYTIIALQKAFLLRSCTEGTFNNRSRPCLLYDIKRCSAPCVGYISNNKYLESIDDAKKFLKGNTKKIEKKLNLKMQIASKKQMYEEAARLRDRIKSINQIQKYQSVYIKEMRNIDIFAIKLVDGKSCIHGKFYRNGSNYGNKSFFPSHEVTAQENEILESFLYQFYADKDVPPKILINLSESLFKEVEKILKLKNKINTRILKPKSGEKLQHVLLAEKNAFESIKLKRSSLESHLSALNRLEKLLNLKIKLNRIEIFDNSHTAGKNAMGVMVVSDRDGLSPKHYRKYNIRYDMPLKNLSTNDDYYMMEEVLTRRLKRLNESENVILPDLIILDGGRGQFNTVLKIIKKLVKKNINLVSVSKGPNRNSGREIIHLKDKNINLKPNDPLLHFIQRLRDEAHRFAITSHRSKRFKSSVKSVFDELKGIGPKRKKMLMLHFGTVDKIKSATLNDLKKIKTIPIKQLKEIYEFFNK